MFSIYFPPQIQSISALLVIVQLCHYSSATYGGSYFSYTTTNHLTSPQYALYKSPAFSNGYQYSYLPTVYTQPAAPVYTHAVYPAVTTYQTYKAPSYYEPAFTAPCAHAPLSS